MNTCKEVQLISGEMVPSDSEAWRLECMGRFILGKRTKEARRAFLDNWAKRHGNESMLELEAVIIKIWEQKQRIAQEG